MPLYTCLVVAIPGGYEAFYGEHKARGKTEEEATAALRAKLALVARQERDRG